MANALTSKGQVTIPKRLRDALRLVHGMPVEFVLNSGGEVVLRPAPPPKGRRATAVVDRFEAARGTADVRWRTDELMKLLRADD